MMNWFTPTLNPEELDKRIGELKTVQFWLEQNGKTLAATIQTLEVQKMTLDALKSMNITPDANAATAGTESAESAAKSTAQAGWDMLSKQFETMVTMVQQTVPSETATAAASAGTTASKATAKKAAAKNAAAKKKPAAKKS